MIVKLIRNYRSHPDIIKQPNHLFYNSELICVGPSEIINSFCGWTALPNPKVPLIFHDVRGKESFDNLTHSCCNDLECEKVIEHLNSLLNEKTVNSISIKQEDIGIITPYRDQVRKIKAAAAANGWKKVKVHTIDEAQGSENLVSILSTVRSKRIEGHRSRVGFLKDPKRFNVAVTRSRALMIIVGNASVLESDPQWKTLVDQCRDDKAWLTSTTEHNEPIARRLRQRKRNQN